MGAASAIFVNDFDLVSLGFHVSEIRGARGGTRHTARTFELPGRAGKGLASGTPSIAPRVVVVDGVLKADTVADVVTNLHRLKGLVARGLLELRFSDDDTRILRARIQDVGAPPIPMQLIQTTVRVSLVFECLDPYWYDVSDTVQAFGASATDMLLGEAVSRPVIKVTGVATNPVVTYRDSGGTLVESMTFGAFTIAAGDFLTIDCDKLTITKSVSSVVTNAIDELTAGDFITLDPIDGDPGTPVWPTLEVSSGSGEATYQKAWQ